MTATQPFAGFAGVEYAVLMSYIRLFFTTILLVCWLGATSSYPSTLNAAATWRTILFWTVTLRTTVHGAVWS